MPETTPLIKAALNLRVGAGFDVYVEKVRVVLKDRYGEMYSCRVIENIPEAVQNGAKFCTASFLVDDRYIDLDQFNKIKCKFSIVFNNKKMYERSKGCKTGKWLMMK